LKDKAPLVTARRHQQGDNAEQESFSNLSPCTSTSQKCTLVVSKQ
jgi:hypothetical protein